MLLAGPPGIGKTTVAKALCNELGVDCTKSMSSTDPMKDDSWILSETMRRTSLRPSRLRQLQKHKESSLMKQITHPMMYNSVYGRLLRSLLATADSSSPATIKTKSSNPSIPVVPSLSSESKEKSDQKLPTVSSLDFKKSLTEKEFSTTQKFLSNCHQQNTSPTGVESSTSVNDTLWVVRLIRGFLRRSQMIER